MDGSLGLAEHAIREECGLTGSDTGGSWSGDRRFSSGDRRFKSGGDRRFRCGYNFVRERPYVCPLRKLKKNVLFTQSIYAVLRVDIA